MNTVDAFIERDPFNEERLVKRSSKSLSFLKAAVSGHAIMKYLDADEGFCAGGAG